MKSIIFAAMATIAFVAPAQAATVVIDAKANSSSGGVGAFGGNFTSGDRIKVNVAATDLWNAGDLPRWSNADGINGPDLIATGTDDSGQAAGTVIGRDQFGDYTFGGLTAPFGTLVGLMGSEYRVLGTNFDGKAWADGSLRLYYWDSFSGDNTQFVTAALSVPEPATWAMMIMGFGLIGAALRRAKPRTSVSFA